MAIEVANGPVAFDEAYFHRPWGGTHLESQFHKPIPATTKRPIGEAWLISDHKEHVSKVASDGRVPPTLHDLVTPEVLGRGAAPTIHGQFPLMLKILDAADYLSVQVHPNDDDAKRLKEKDVGKTEMWYILDAEPGSEIICGMPPDITPEQFRAAIDDKSIGDILTRYPVQKGDAIFVPAGTVHAIGPGLVIAEIQQNSDTTYRVYDWDRKPPRELHIDKALAVTRFGSSHSGPSTPLPYAGSNARITVLAACRYFAARLIEPSREFACPCPTFHILFGVSGQLTIESGKTRRPLTRGTALLVPAKAQNYIASPESDSCAYLDYHVPDLRADIIAPLRDLGGFDSAKIVALGGDLSTNDLAPFVSMIA